MKGRKEWKEEKTERKNKERKRKVKNTKYSIERKGILTKRKMKDGKERRVK